MLRQCCFERTNGIGLGVETTRMIIDRNQIHLVENRLRVLAGQKIICANAIGHIEIVVEYGVAETIARPERPVLTSN